MYLNYHLFNKKKHRITAYKLQYKKKTQRSTDQCKL